MFTPTKEQKKLIDSSDSAVVIAGPGRGKTLTAIAAADTWATAHPSRRVLFTSYERDFDSARGRFVSTAEWKSVDVTTFEGRNYRCAATDILDFAEAVLHGERFSGHSSSVSCDGMYANQRRSYIALRCQSIWKRFPGASIGIIAPNSRTERELAAELRTPKKGVKAAIPVHAVIEVDPAWADAFRLATFAASDYAREPNVERRRCFAVTLTALERASRRGTPPGIARLGEIEKLLSSSSKRKSALRDFLASPQPESVSEFAVQFAASLSADKAFDAVGHRIEKSGVPTIRPIASVEQFDTFRASRNPAGLHGAECWRARTTMLSMYRAKGREFDHVIVVTDPRAHKRDAAEGELRRLHYVACTRARQSLTVLWNSSGIGDVLGPVLALGRAGS